MISKRKRKSPIVTTMEWTADHAAYFGAVPCDWTHPKKIKITRTRRGYTIAGVFVSPNGHRSTVTSRFEDGERGLELVGRDYRIAFPAMAS